jgi:anti-anti-sigma regulatory factor
VIITEVPSEVIVHVAGKGCVGAADALAAALLSINARRPSLVTPELSGLSCISSLTMGVLTRFRQGVVRAGGQVRLATSLQVPVREALERAGLFVLFDPPRGHEMAS